MSHGRQYCLYEWNKSTLATGLYQRDKAVNIPLGLQQKTGPCKSQSDGGRARQRFQHVLSQSIRNDLILRMIFNVNGRTLSSTGAIRQNSSASGHRSDALANYGKSVWVPLSEWH